MGDISTILYHSMDLELIFELKMVTKSTNLRGEDLVKHREFQKAGYSAHVWRERNKLLFYWS